MIRTVLRNKYDEGESDISEIETADERSGVNTQNPLLWKCATRKVALRGGLAALVFLLSAPVPAQTPVREWVQRYNSSGGALDQATAVVVEGSGDIIVTGRSWGTGIGSDYLTIKYTAAGTPLWTNRYNGPEQGDDQPAALAVDDSGDVVVTGYFSSNGSAAFGTIKYSRSGMPLWTNRYYGPGTYDYATAVAVDHSDNVFVTGCSGSENYFLYYNLDCATIKYSSAGVPLWTNRYNGDRSTYPTAIAVDGNGDVIVTGYTINWSRSSSGSGTIKYSSEGTPLWTNRNTRINAKALAVDANSNVFVTGYGYNNNSDFMTIAYSGAGVTLWTNRFDGSQFATAVAVDRSGNVFVTGHSYTRDYATIKFSNEGAPLWTNLYSGLGGGTDDAVALAVDGNGDVIVTGYSMGSSSSNDIATVKYSGAGVPMWTNRYNGPGNGDDRATALAVDGTGNIYVTGYSTGSGTGYDYVTIKYSVLNPIPLTAERSGDQLLLTWTNSAFGLQCGPTITGPFTNLSGATSPCTNPISDAQRFFRLISN